MLKSPVLFVTIERTGTRSSSEPFARGLSGYTFPFGAVLPNALYRGMSNPVFSGSSPSWYIKLFKRNEICRVKYPELGHSKRLDIIIFKRRLLISYPAHAYLRKIRLYHD